MGESPNCMELIHKPVLVKETLSFLNPCPGQVFIDGTVGDGGHAMEILALIGPAGKLFAFDRDEKSNERGFSYDSDEPLDMRLDRSQKLTAAEVVNGWPEDKLIWVFQEYGQENF